VKIIRLLKAKLRMIFGVRVADAGVRLVRIRTQVAEIDQIRYDRMHLSNGGRPFHHHDMLDDRRDRKF
jgi:hypothetical protein